MSFEIISAEENDNMMNNKEKKHKNDNITRELTLMRAIFSVQGVFLHDSIYKSQSGVKKKIRQ